MSPRPSAPPSRPTASAVEVIDTADGLKPLEAEWNELLERYPGRTPFLTFEWATTWLDTLGRDVRPLVIVVRGPQGVQAIAPFCIQDRGLLTFVGYPNSDYADVLVDPHHPQALAMVVETLYRTGGWRRGLLDQFPENGSQWRALQSELDRAHRPYRLLMGDTCPARTLEDPAAAKKQYYKKNINNYVNWFSKRGDFSHRICAPGQETLARLEDLFEQHIHRWDKTATPSTFRFEATKQFYRRFVAAMDARGWITLSMLSLDDEFLALYLLFEYEGALYLYKPTFNVEYWKRSPGQVILRYLLDHALERGLREIDYMRGDEGYKERFADVVRTNRQIHLYRHAAALRWASGLHALRHSKLADLLLRNARVQRWKHRFLRWRHTRG